MALLGRRDWMRMQGRTNAAMLLTAREMGAEFVAPADERQYGEMRGRTRGCTFELRVANGNREPALELTIRHFHTQARQVLDGDGVRVPDIDPALLRDAIEQVCNAFATER